MLTDGGEAIDDDVDDKEFMQELYGIGKDSEITRLTEMVRKHYLNYLEKQLHENLKDCSYNDNKNNEFYKEEYDDEMCKRSVKKTAELLEDKAVKACMIAKFYQRAMVKIIEIVRRTTQEKKLFTYLEKCIKTKSEHKPIKSSKETQTEACLLQNDSKSNESICYDEATIVNQSVENKHDKHKMSLDEKIEIFQKHLHKEKCIDIARKYPVNNKQKITKRQYKHHPEHKYYSKHQRHYEEQHPREKQEVYFSPTPSVITEPTAPVSPVSKPPPLNSFTIENKESIAAENENSNDSVALELARLFSEEKTELDEIFGIDPNDEPDDPQICKILKEIEEAKVNQNKSPTEPQTIIENPPTETVISFIEPKKLSEQFENDLSLSIDLSKSIWPCELFMQRRKLSASLARLIEEDLRWHDIMKWKFCELFGEDSDDEFTPCSPSIELDEVLICSCIRRISPWVVKHLMKPMRDGLIGNRFLFKKLAKNLARSIIMENQYPDESIIKECVENFFCLHQAVMSLEDLDVDMPSITSYF